VEGGGAGGAEGEGWERERSCGASCHQLKHLPTQPHHPQHPLDPDALDAHPAEVLEACRERALFMQAEVAAAHVDPSDVWPLVLTSARGPARVVLVKYQR